MAESKNNLWRLFIALSIPRHVAQCLHEFAQDVQRGYPDLPIRWLARERYHITLCFLGDTNPGDIPVVRQELDKLASAATPIEVHSRGVGIFPTSRDPTVVWVGVEDARDALPDLAQQLRTAFAPILADARPARFLGHITIGRCRRTTAANKRQFKELMRVHRNREFGSWRASALYLMRSHIDHRGANYTEIARFPFSAA